MQRLCNVDVEKTKAWAPITQFFMLERFITAMTVIVDTGKEWNITLVQMALDYLRNFDALRIETLNGPVDTVDIGQVRAVIPSHLAVDQSVEFGIHGQ